MSIQHLFNKVIEHDYKNGETFANWYETDFDSFNTHTFMTWCLGRRYISPEQYDKWSECYFSKDIFRTRALTCLGGKEDSTFVIILFHDKDFNTIECRFIYEILAEFISEIDINKHRDFSYLEGV